MPRRKPPTVLELFHAALNQVMFRSIELEERFEKLQRHERVLLEMEVTLYALGYYGHEDLDRAYEAYHVAKSDYQKDRKNHVRDVLRIRKLSEMLAITPQTHLMLVSKPGVLKELEKNNLLEISFDG